MFLTYYILLLMTSSVPLELSVPQMNHLMTGRARPQPGETKEGPPKFRVSDKNSQYYCKTPCDARNSRVYSRSKDDGFPVGYVAYGSKCNACPARCPNGVEPDCSGTACICRGGNSQTQCQSI